MKKTKTQKGITLIALIITIIVLLILAVVAIGAVQNDGIINHARNARDEYQAAQRNEQTALDNYLAKLDENAGTSTSTTWTQNGRTVTNGKGTTLNVGDTVNYVSGVLVGTGEYETKYETMYDYDENGEIISQWEEPIEEEEIMKPYEEYGGGWKILGAENGQILLISTTAVSDISYDSYDKGEYTTGIRNVKLEDIDRITGYDKTTFGAGTVYQYGNKITYTLGEDDDTVTVSAEGKPELTFSFSVEEDNMDDYTLGESYSFDNIFYEYDLTTYFPDTDDDLAYVMLFKNADNTDYIIYNLDPSNFDFYSSAYDGFGFAGGLSHSGKYTIYNGDLNVSGSLFSVGGCGTWSENYDFDYEGFNLTRAVISLESDVVLSRNSDTDPWTISK